MKKLDPGTVLAGISAAIVLFAFCTYQANEPADKRELRQTSIPMKTTATTRQITAAATEAPTTTTTSTTTTTTTVATDTNVGSKSLGTFKIVGYSSEEATVGTVSASGLPLIPGKTCAMNRGDMKKCGIEYGDYIEVVGISRLQATDCGCRSGKVDVYCATIADCYAITQMAEVIKN